jgi:hypothetical protein
LKRFNFQQGGIKMRITTWFLGVIMIILFSGCTNSPSPMSEILLHGKSSNASATYNFTKIKKNKKIYVKDVTDWKSFNKWDMYYSASIGLKGAKQCAPGDKIKTALKKDGYKIVNNINNADYLIVTENLGCGVYMVVRNNLRKPKSLKKILDMNYSSTDNQKGFGKISYDDYNESVKYDNANSFASLSSSLSSSGYGGAGAASAALSVLSLFGNSSPDDNFFVADAITIVNLKKKKAERAIYYTYANSNEGIKYGDSGFIKNCNKNITSLLSIELEPVKVLGVF